MKALRALSFLWLCTFPLLANDMHWVEDVDLNIEAGNLPTPSSPPKEFFSLNTLYLRNKVIVHVGHDLINQDYVVMPSPNILRIEKLPNDRRRVVIQQYFPELHEKVLSTYNITANKLHFLYIKTYEIYDQNGNLLETLRIPDGVQYRPPQYYTLEVEKSVKTLSFIFGFTGRTAWSDSGISSDLQGIYKDLRLIGVDRASALKIDINAASGIKAVEVLTSRENQKLGQILSDFQHVIAWGRMAQKEDLINKIADLRNFDTVHIDLAKGAEDLKKYPHIFGDPLNPKFQNLIKKMSSEKLSEKEYSSEFSASAKLGLGSFFSAEGGGSSKQHSRLKEMVKFDIEGEMYIPKSLDFIIRTNDSFDLIKTLVFQAYDHLEEAYYRIGSGVSLSPIEEVPEFSTKHNTVSAATAASAAINFSCAESTVLGGIKSTRSGAYDRSFQHECRDIAYYQNPVQKTNCQFSNALNAQATNFKFECGENSFLSGEKSSYLNGDRAYSYQCCSLASEGINIKKKQCTWSGWLNAMGAAVGYLCPENTVLAGAQTEYLPYTDNPWKIRRYRIPVASLGDRRYNYLCCSYGVE